MSGSWKCPACDVGFDSWKLLLEHATRENHTAYTRLRRKQNVEGTTSESHTSPSASETHHAHAQTNDSNSSATHDATPIPAMACDMNAPAFSTHSWTQTVPIPLGGTQSLNSQPSPSTPRSKCSICDISFPSATALDVHYQASIMHPSCGACGKSCLDKTELTTHLQVVHAVTLCDCGVAVRTAHLREHYNASSCHPICPICGIGVKDARDLHELHSPWHVDALQHQSGAGAGACSEGGVSAQESLAGKETESGAVAPAGTAVAPVIAEAQATEHFTKEIELAAEVLNEAQPDASPLDDRSSIHLDVKILSPKTKEAEQSHGSPMHKPSVRDCDAMVVLEEAEHDEGILSEDVNTVNAAIQVDPPSDERRPDSVLSYITDLDSDMGILSATSSCDLIETSSASARVSIPPSTPGYSTVHSGMVEGSGSGRSFISPSRSVESDTYLRTPPSNACTLGQTTCPPSPPQSLYSSTHTLSIELPDTRPPSHAPSGLRRSSAVRDWAERSMNPMHTQPENLRPTSTSSERRTGAPSSRPQHTIPPPSNPVLPQTGPSWHCRSCGKDPCDDPTATVCGHIFCHQCIVRELAENMQCPVCRKMYLLKLHVD